MVPSQNEQGLAASQQRLVMDLDRCIIEWLHEKHKRGESEKTKKAYEDALKEFRELLQNKGLDLDSAPAIIAPLARRWCGYSKRGEGVDVAPTTFNQRRSILSSFYTYAILNEVLDVNPVARFQSRKIRKKHAARPISKTAVSQSMSKINLSTLQGKRDKALLALALTTGRRVSELAGLRVGHITRDGGETHVFWERCKGNESAENILDERTATVLFEYLEALYGSKELAGVMHKTPTSPVWTSFSRNTSKGEALGIRAIQRICDKHLNTSKFHALRHTWAVSMERQGASLSEIGKGLGHKNLKTTSDYLDELIGYENPHAKELAQDFGI